MRGRQFEDLSRGDGGADRLLALVLKQIVEVDLLLILLAPDRIARRAGQQDPAPARDQRLDGCPQRLVRTTTLRIGVTGNDDILAGWHLIDELTDAAERHPCLAAGRLPYRQTSFW